MDDITVIFDYEHLKSRYRFTFHGFAGLIEWEELVELNGWQKLFNPKQEYKWRRIYFGNIAPIQKCMEAFKRGMEALDDKETYQKHYELTKREIFTGKNIY